MRHFPLIWKGVWRNKGRTVFTLLSIMVAFLLFGLLQGITAAFNGSVASASLNRLYVDSRFGLGVGLPIAAMSAIEKVPGVSSVAYATWFGGYYQDPHRPIFALAVDPTRYFSVYPELRLPAAQMLALKNTRTAAVISDKLARKYGWGIGDRVPLRSSIWTRQADGSSNWTFDIVGVFTSTEGKRTHTDFLFNQDYFDEARAFGRGKVGWYILQVNDLSQAATIAAAIDKRFENSPDETHTQNEQETAQSLLREHGDINLIVNLIVGAVFFALLFLTGNTMMQSVRERIPEFAVLKTIGYPSLTVSGIIVSEVLLICFLAAASGLIAAWVLFPMLSDVTGTQRLPVLVLLIGTAVAVLVALLTALPSVIRLRRMNVVDALAGR